MKKIGKITLKEQIKENVILNETEMKNIVGGSSSGSSDPCAGKSIGDYCDHPYGYGTCEKLHNGMIDCVL